MNEKIVENDGKTSLLDDFIDFGEEDVVFAEEQNVVNCNNSGNDTDEPCLKQPEPKVESSVANQPVADEDPFFKMDIDQVNAKSEIYQAKIIFGKYMQKPFGKTTKERTSSSNNEKKRLDKKDEFLINPSKKRNRDGCLSVIPKEKKHVSHNAFNHVHFVKKNEMNAKPQKRVPKKSFQNNEQKSKAESQKENDRILAISEANRGKTKLQISHIAEKKQLQQEDLFNSRRIDMLSENVCIEKNDKLKENFFDAVKKNKDLFSSAFNEKESFFFLEDSSKKRSQMSFEQKGNLKKWKL